MTVAVPLPGDFGVVPVHGAGGTLIRLGQYAAGDGFADYEHAVICVSTYPNQAQVKVVEAEPGGARFAYYRLNDPAKWSTGAFDLTQQQRDLIVREARSYVGTPYSWLDYWAIAAHRFHLPIPWLRRYIDSTKHMICSQLVAEAYRAAGINLARQGWDGYVTPADLYQWIKDAHPASE